MMLTEETAVPTAVLPIQLLRDHLRFGTGFAEDGLQDSLLDAYLRAAIAAIEARIGKILVSRQFRWTLEEWRGSGAQALPVAPVQAVTSVTLVDAGGAVAAVAPTSYRLVKDLHRPRLVAVASTLPTVPTAGHVEIEFTAGFGPEWTDVPADLQQAVLLLSAEHYEQRSELGTREAGLPFGIMALIERWRTVRVLGGGGA